MLDKKNKNILNILLYTLFLGVLVHGFVLSNYLPSFDSMYCFTSTGASFSSGRIFVDLFGYITSLFDMSWVNGILTILLIGVSIYLIVDLFDLYRYKFLVILLFITFPAVTSLFVVMFTSDVYAFSMLFSTLSVYLIVKSKNGIFIAPILLMLSIGIYQAYLTYAISLITLFLIRLIVVKKDFSEILKYIIKFIMVLLSGLCLYLLVKSILLKFIPVSLSNYQGINSLGFIKISELSSAIKNIFSSFLFFIGIGEDGIKIYGIINILLIFLYIIISIIIMFKHELQKSKIIILYVLLVIFLPFSSFLIYLFSTGVEYHSLMIMGMVFIYLFIIMFADKLKIKSLAILSILVFMYWNYLNANKAYWLLNFNYEKSYNIASDILQRIEMSSEFDYENTKIALIGNYYASSTGVGVLDPIIHGVMNSSILIGHPDHFINSWNYMFGIQLNLVSDDKMYQIKQSDEFKLMKVYPHKDCVNVIEDVIVVKLGN